MFLFTLDHLALIANTPVQAESLLHSQKQATRNSGLYLNSNKAEFMCFNQDGAISSLNGKPPKFVDQFLYIGRNISSMESDVTTCLSKVWATINRLTTIWKSALPVKIKQGFF